MHYLATPYTARKDDGTMDMNLMVRRFEQTCVLVGALAKTGLHVWSPIVHWHPVAIRVNLPHDYAFWQHINHEQIERSSGLLVPELPGVDTSVGVKAECDFAVGLGLPVEILPETRVLELLYEEGWQLVV